MELSGFKFGKHERYFCSLLIFVPRSVKANKEILREKGLTSRSLQKNVESGNLTNILKVSALALSSDF